MDFAEGSEILLFEHVGLRGADMQLLRETIRAQTVCQAVTHRLDVAALVRRDVVHRNLIHQAGHILMEISPGTERFNQRLIP